MSSLRARAAIAVALPAALAVRHVIERGREIDLHGKIVLITGGSKGLGLVLARDFGREGCRVAICAREDKELQAARQKLAGEDLDVTIFRCDVSDGDAVREMVGAVERQLGPIDVLVNNAGIIQMGAVGALGEDDFAAAQDVIFWGTLRPILAVLPGMRARGTGRIVNITSIAGRAAIPHLVPYSAAKFAALGLSEGLRAELQRDGILVTTVVPGLMRTGGYRNAVFAPPAEQEFVWFALGDSLPFVSIGVERAARLVIQATRRGAAEVTIGLPAVALSRFHGVFPGATADLLGVANRLLPRRPGRDIDAPPGELRRGGRLEHRITSAVFRAATTLGRHAAQRFQPKRSGDPTVGNRDERRKEAAMP